MYNTSENAQVHHSLEALSDALFEAMREKPFRRVTVTEICRRAGLTRRTYYRNVEDRIDLVDWKTDDLVTRLIEGTDYESVDAVSLYGNFFRFWFRNRQFLATVYAQGLFARFERRFVNNAVIAQDYSFLEEFLEGKEGVETYRLFHNAFIMGGLCTVLAFWTASGFAAPVEALVETLVHFAPEYRPEPTGL